MPDLFSLVGPVLRRFEPERAHELTLRALELGLAGRARWKPDAMLRVHRFGLDFAHPVGLAAGFDKDARVPDRMLDLGFAFVEIGTVTPRPQLGNPRPRIFRLHEDRALINRLGFNNGGLVAAAARLSRLGSAGVIGANIGRNKDSADAVADYVRGYETLAPLAHYVTVNISSPNTPGLRDLHAVESLHPLLDALVSLRGTGAESERRPILLKISPDLADVDAIAAAELSVQLGIDGLIVSNTTISRPVALRSPLAAEAGGLSGPPLMARATELIAVIHRATAGRLPIVGLGGIASAEDAYAKILAGASLLQLYTALVYQGPALVARIVEELPRLLRSDGFATLDEAVGADC